MRKSVEWLLACWEWSSHLYTYFVPQPDPSTQHAHLPDLPKLCRRINRWCAVRSGVGGL